MQGEGDSEKLAANCLAHRRVPIEDRRDFASLGYSVKRGACSQAATGIAH
jgi:hypothetical protein